MLGASGAAVAAPIIGALATGAFAYGADALKGDDGPPQLDERRRKTLGSFATRLAQQGPSRGDSNSFLLRPGGTPIRFAPYTPPYSGPMTFR